MTDMLNNSNLKPPFFELPYNFYQKGCLSAAYGALYQKEHDLPKADIILLAFKPQDLGKAMDSYREYLKKDQLIISILAGISTSIILNATGLSLPIIRTMPNLALGVGESATAYCLGDYANDTHAQVAEAIFQTLGSVTRVAEADIDAVTGLSGSGPAYIFYLLEAMIEGACRQGLSESKAKELAAQTLIGSAKLLQEDRAHPRDIRKRITSAKGTTEAAIKAMQELHFAETIAEGIAAATNRSKQLGKAFEENLGGN
jgi:pyrroline-5-carboxylate reductase